VVLAALVVLSARFSANQAAPINHWFGPVTAAFYVQFGGNPYDPEQNDCHVHFTGDNGLSFDRPAYFEKGAWRAVLVAPQSGKYKAALLHNDKPVIEPSIPPVLVCTTPLNHGFVRRAPNYTNRFEYDDDTLIYPFGYNLAWQDTTDPKLEDSLAQMGKDGLSWVRIWADAVDDLDPLWTKKDSFALADQLWQKALDRWDLVTIACSSAGLHYQMVLFDQRESSKEGFAKTSPSFFSDPESKRKSKMWLHYAVARWGADPNLFAWELFSRQSLGPGEPSSPDAVAWHKEMADYVRSIDPYHHLVASGFHAEDVQKEMDFEQPHVFADEVAPPSRRERPAFVGEFGSTEDLQAKEYLHIRDAIWSNLLTNPAAPPMYWFWNRMGSDSLDTEFVSWARVFRISGIAAHPKAKQIAIKSAIGTGTGLRDFGWTLIRLRGASGRQARISWPGLSAGEYKASIFDLDSERHISANVKLTSFFLTPQLGSNDIVIAISN
jgi:hypothetical protein